MNCSECSQSASFKGYRGKTLTSLFGRVRLPRAYYHCSTCCEGRVPWDETLRLGWHPLTPAAEQLVTLAGCLDSFEEAAAKILPQMTGIELSPSTVRRTTEDVGGRIGKALAEKQTFGDDEIWDWYQDIQGRSCAYVSVDATGVPQQGPKGEKSEGRMEWVGMVYNPTPADWKGKRPPWQARYVTSLTTLAGLGVPLRAQAGQVGFDQAQRWIALSDGGSGIEDFLRVNFPHSEAHQLVVIIDFYHVAEHLCDFAKISARGNQDRTDTLCEAWCHELKHEGGRSLIATLEDLDIPDHGDLREAYDDLLSYLRNNAHRMDYPTYLSRGWHIGSGPVEAGCKTVVGGRLKGTGMRWRSQGTSNLSHVRALYKSESTQWAAYWQRCPYEQPQS